MTFSYYASYSLRSGFTLVHYRGEKTKDDCCMRYGSNTHVGVLLVFSHPQRMKPVWLCFELHQNHRFPASLYVVSIRPSVFAFILHPQGPMLLGEVSSVVQCAAPPHQQRLVPFPSLSPAQLP